MKKKLIALLEGRTFKTANGWQGCIKNSQYHTKSGAIVKLASLTKYHLEQILKQSKAA